MMSVRLVAAPSMPHIALSGGQRDLTKRAQYQRMVVWKSLSRNGLDEPE
ncbi:hypothetical protein DFR70_114155 [Nocardia tenerifensis]|uniref:Uncharacterized protein n=1 Tax=Nocardia tenerifensis TaxID=228006 RepID=A0A318JXL4_9NOCA|nr:hypothetical protein DFR70_114155 [Nocardia tenerifensis]